MKSGEISVSKAAEIAGVTPAAVYSWIKLKKLDGIYRKHFSKIYLHEEKFKKWVKEQTT